MDAATSAAYPENYTSDSPSVSREAEAAKIKNESQESEYTTSRSSKFRFKSSKSRTKHDSSRYPPQRDSGTNHNDTEDYKSHRRRRHHSHRSFKRHKTDQTASPASPSHNNERSLSPETAFRESLFDALGDDEGASYWQSVYGQPIHTYAVPSVPKGPDGELERMTDEEYASYVRARMFEKSHEGIMEERERQRREKAKAKRRAEAEGRADKDRMRFDQVLEESLQRGENRRRAKSWRTIWEKYLKSWEDLAGLSKEIPEEESRKQFHIRNYIHWPVESGKRRDISREAVKEFMQHSPTTATDSSVHESFLNALKAERIRWHPDKMLHRYRSLGLGDEKALLQSVTEVFQILDDLWIEGKDRHSER